MENVDTRCRVGIIGVCVDAHSYAAVSNLVMTVAGGALLGNIKQYAGAEREAGRALEKAKIRICIIDFDENAEEAIWTVDRMRSAYPDVFLFASSSYTDPDRVVAAMRAGCSEYLIKPIQSTRMLEAISQVEVKEKERSRSRVRGKVVTMIGAKGGAGVTSLALHLALNLAKLPKSKCLLVDQHPVLGDASLYLGTGRHEYSFYELATNTDRLDEELLRGFLLHHDSGLDLLDSPEAFDAVHYASPGAVEQTLSFLSENYKYVVVDCPPGLSEATMACIAQSSQIALVMTAELPCVRNAVRYLEHLAKIGYGPNTVRIILNRHSKKGPLPDDRIEKALGQPIWLRIPNSYNEVIRAINAGTPITDVDNSDFAASIGTWARELSGSGEATAQAATASHGGFFGLFSR